MKFFVLYIVLILFIISCQPILPTPEVYEIQSTMKDSTSDFLLFSDYETRSSSAGGFISEETYPTQTTEMQVIDQVPFSGTVKVPAILERETFWVVPSANPRAQITMGEITLYVEPGDTLSITIIGRETTKEGKK